MQDEDPITEKRDSRAPGTDGALASTPAAETPLEPERRPGGAWQWGGVASVTYSLRSSDRIEGLLMGGMPTLVVRCWQPARHELWFASTDDSALFAPDGATVARRLGTAKTLAFEFTPALAEPLTVTFNLAGVDGVVAHVAKACGWTPGPP
jgi:hypothetical protein